jgi:Resolvase, N terminal domain
LSWCRARPASRCIGGGGERQQAASRRARVHFALGASGRENVSVRIPTPLRGGLYARVSTDEQDAGLQLDDLRQVAGQRGWVIADEYVDEAISGTEDERPAFDRLMADARAGKLDIVAVWRFDRFAR